MRIAGRWRITEAELCDCDALNLAAPAFTEFAEDWSSGSFGFIAAQGRWTAARRPKAASEHPSSGGLVVR